MARVPPYNPHCRGEGHVMGMEIGARTVNMDVVTRATVRFIPASKRVWHELLPSHPLLIQLYATGARILPEKVFASLANKILTTRGAPDSGLYREGAILVNNEGKRFTNELSNDLAVSIAQQPENRAYVVFDSRLARKFTSWPYFVSTAVGIAYAYIGDYERDAADVISKGNTLEEASRIHPNPEELVRSVHQYNQFVTMGNDPGAWSPFFGGGHPGTSLLCHGTCGELHGRPPGGWTSTRDFKSWIGRELSFRGFFRRAETPAE